MADSVKIRITGDDSAYRKTLGGLGSVTKSVVKGFTVASAAINAAWGAIGAVGIKYNSEIEALQTSFEVMTGSAQKAAEITERLRKIGAETPFDLKGLASTTKLLMNYGFEADRAVAEMMMLGDIAQGNAEAMTSIATGYAQMSSLGKVNLQDIKQMINGGFNPLQEISERTGESMEKLYARISKGTMAVDEITESMRHATSEGGKYYQSMEKQAQTFQGRLETLKEDATAFTGQIMTSVADSLRDSVIPMASDMLAEFSEAFSTGGFDGLIDAITAKIPELLDKAIDMLKQGISGLAKWLPGAVKQIATVIPGALRAILDVSPQIVQSLFEVAASLVSDLITMLPELIPTILEGVGKMLLSVGQGVMKLLNGVLDGIGSLLGIKGDEMTEAINGLFANVNTERLATISAKVKARLTTEVTTDDYIAKIDAAIEAIKTALLGVEELDDATREKIRLAIISGSGLDLLSTAFADSFPSVDITPITDAMDTINAALEGLGLSPEAKEKINELITAGAEASEIEDALVSFGVNPVVAALSALTISSAMTNVNVALEGLGLSEDAKTQITELVAAGASAGEIEAALIAFGVSDEAAKAAAESLTTEMDRINTAINGLGLSEGATTAIARLVEEGASSSEIADALVSFGVDEGIAEAAAKTITDEMATINAAVASIGLSEDAKKHILGLVNNNASVSEITKALESYGISKNAAKATAKTITDEMSTINAAVKELKLSKDAAAHIGDLVDKNASKEEIEAALKSYGVDSTAADEAAGKITSGMDSINTAVDGLKLPEGSAERLTLSAISGRIAIATALQMYGLKDEQIETILESYDSVTGSLTASANALFTNLATTFTDGKWDDKEKAQKAVKEFYAGVCRDINDWANEAIEEAKASGLIGEELDGKIAEIEQSRASMLASAENLESQSMDWVEANANRSTAFVQGNLAALQSILAEAQQITAQIDILTNKAFDNARSRRTLVKKGAVKSEEHQIEAFGITAAELKQRLDAADNEAAAAFDKAAEKFANDSEGYAKEEKRILDQLAAEKKAAYDQYNAETAAIIAGIVKASPNLVEQLGGIRDLIELSGVAEGLRQKIADALSLAWTTGEPVDFSGFFDNLTAEGVDLTKLAESLGMTPEQLQDAIANELKSGEGGGQVTTAINDLITGEGGINSQITKALEKGGVDLGGTADVLAKAVEDGYLKAGIDNVDWTKYKTQFDALMAGVGQAGVDGLSSKADAAETAAGEVAGAGADAADAKKKFKTSGENSGQGWITGFNSKVDSMITAAENAAKEITRRFRAALGISSPSKVFMQLGGFTGQGFETGYVKSMQHAIKTARSLAGSLVGAANMPVRLPMPNISEAIMDVMAATDSQATPVYLDSKQIASIQRNNNNVAITRHSRRVLMGYGGR